MSTVFVRDPNRSRIQFAGEDRLAFPHNLCTQDIQALGEGQVGEAFITDVRGKTIGHGFFFAHGERLIFDGVGGHGERLANHFEKYHIREQVEITDISSDSACVWLVGPQSNQALSELHETVLEPFTCRKLETGLLARVSCFGEPSYEWLIEKSQLDEVCDRLAGAGMQEASLEDLESLRVRAGFPQFGVDFGESNLPQELDRDDHAISFTKGCYLGQETVARVDALGHVNWILRRIQPLDGDQVPNPGDEVEQDGHVQLRFTTVVPLDGGRFSALAMVRSAVAQQGRLASPWGTLEIQSPGDMDS